MKQSDQIGSRNRHCLPRHGETGERTYSANWLDFYWQPAETDSDVHQAGWWFAGNAHGTTRFHK